MSRDSRIRIVEVDGVRTMKFVRAQQSSMRLDDPFETDFEYPGYLHIALALNPAVQRTLMLGLGGGTVAKRMWRDYPDMRIDAVEIDPDVVDACVAYFELPEDDRLRVHVAEGRAFLEASSDTYDLIVVDAFDDEVVPIHLLTEEFLRACRDRLSPDGVIAYNVTGSVAGDRSKPFRSLYRTLANVFRSVWVFPIGLSAGGPPGEHRNIIVFATDTRVSERDLLARIASCVDGLVSVPGFEHFGDDLYRATMRTGDVPLLLDPAPKRRR